MFGLGMTTFPQICCQNAQIDECIALAEEKGTANWKIQAMAHRGCVLALVGESTEAISTISSGYGWFTEGFDTRDLKDAKALREELAT